MHDWPVRSLLPLVASPVIAGLVVFVTLIAALALIRLLERALPVTGRR